MGSSFTQAEGVQVDVQLVWGHLLDAAGNDGTNPAITVNYDPPAGSFHSCLNVCLARSEESSINYSN